MDDPKETVRRGFDRVSRAYRADDADEAQYGPWLELLEKKLAPGADVLDLGCGCGIGGASPVPVLCRHRRRPLTGPDRARP